MDDLKKAQMEYMQRVNDPSYVAPDILRTPNRKRAGYLETVAAQPVERKVNLESYLETNAPKFSESDINDSTRLFPKAQVKDNRFAEKEYLAERLGMKLINGVPVVTPEQDDELNKAIEKQYSKNYQGEPPNEREQMLLKLMTED